MMRTTIVAALAASLAACGSSGTITRDRIVTVKEPVPQPCASQRPAPVVTLRAKYPNWYDMDVKQKAAAVGAQGLERQTYGEQLDAATGACP